MEREDLKRLGLRGYEVAAYRALLSRGRLEARELAEASGLPPTAAYPVLRALKRKGLVQEFLSDPRAYSAIPPAAGLKAYAEKRAEEVRLAGARATAELVRTAPPGAPGRAEPVTLSFGLLSSRNLTEGLIAGSKRSLHILGWSFHRSKNKDFYRTLRGLGNLVDSGVDVRILARSAESGAKKFLRDFSSRGIKMKLHPVENLSLVISDGARCKITLKNPGLGERVNVSVSDPALAGAMESYFLSLWRAAGKTI